MIASEQRTRTKEHMWWMTTNWKFMKTKTNWTWLWHYQPWLGYRHLGVVRWIHRHRRRADGAEHRKLSIGSWVSGCSSWTSTSARGTRDSSMVEGVEVSSGSGCSLDRGTLLSKYLMTASFQSSPWCLKVRQDNGSLPWSRKVTSGSRHCKGRWVQDDKISQWKQKSFGFHEPLQWTELHSPFWSGIL